MSRIVAAVLAAAVLTGCSSAVSGEGAPAPTGSATGTAGPSIPGCPGAAVGTDATDLAAALKTTTGRDASFRLTGDEAVTLDQAGLFGSTQGPAAVRAELVAAGFEGGRLRTWAGPAANGRGDSEALVVHRFATPAGACRFADFRRRAEAMTTIDLPGVPGALGGLTKNTGYTRAFSLAVKGPYVVSGDAASFTSQAAAAPAAAALLRKAYDAL